jgi:hypothetical protein
MTAAVGRLELPSRQERTHLKANVESQATKKLMPERATGALAQRLSGLVIGPRPETNARLQATRHSCIQAAGHALCCVWGRMHEGTCEILTHLGYSSILVAIGRTNPCTQPLRLHAYSDGAAAV